MTVKYNPRESVITLTEKKKRKSIQNVQNLKKHAQVFGRKFYVSLKVRSNFILSGYLGLRVFDTFKVICLFGINKFYFLKLSDLLFLWCSVSMYVIINYY